MSDIKETLECSECHEPIPPDELVHVNGEPLHVRCLGAVLDKAIGGVTDSYRRYFGE